MVEVLKRIFNEVIDAFKFQYVKRWKQNFIKYFYLFSWKFGKKKLAFKMLDILEQSISWKQLINAVINTLKLNDDT